MALLEVEELRVEFTGLEEPVRAVNGVDLEIERGEIVGLVGESGSGKTVTSLSILGLIRRPGRVTSGSIRLDGVDLRTLGPEELREIRGARISYVPQSPRGALNPLLRIGKQMENILVSHGAGRRQPATELRRRTVEMIEAVGIPDPERVLRAYPHELSGGMAQRAVIANAMILRPDLVIADEPTTGLDVTVQAQILDLFSERVRDQGAGALLVTHDLGIVANYCTRIAVMYAGRIVETGPARDVFQRPRHPYTVGLLRSVPVLGQPLFSMPGQAPDLRALPPGCAFAARCADARSECAAVAPPWREVAGGKQRFLCHLEAGAPL